VKELINLRWRPLWTSHLGCLKGCLDYLKKDVSEAWLFGATAHAFILNIHEVVCPSGPTAWRGDFLFKLGRNIGFTVDVVDAWKGQDDFAEKQKLAWDNTRQAIDDGYPCYGWELKIPEFYVVYGYDEAGYFYSGPMADNGEGPLLWQKLGTSDIGCLGMYRVRASEPAGDVHTVRVALATAVKFAEDPGEWIYDKYRSGTTGYNLWINALNENRAHPWGMAYNSAVWAECRHFAAEFLKEARNRLDGCLSALFDEAIEHYGETGKQLNHLTALFPFPPGEELKDENKRAAAVKRLEQARDAEAKGVEMLKKLLLELS